LQLALSFISPIFLRDSANTGAIISAVGSNLLILRDFFSVGFLCSTLTVTLAMSHKYQFHPYLPASRFFIFAWTQGRQGCMSSDNLCQQERPSWPGPLYIVSAREVGFAILVSKAQGVTALATAMTARVWSRAAATDACACGQSAWPRRPCHWSPRSRSTWARPSPACRSRTTTYDSETQCVQGKMPWAKCNLHVQLESTRAAAVLKRKAIEMGKLPFILSKPPGSFVIHAVGSCNAWIFN
jgi:hypothetical protein